MTAPRTTAAHRVAPQMTVADIDAFLRREFSESFNEAGGYTIENADGHTCRVRQRYRPDMLRPGGTISGPTLMSLADVAMYIVILSALGPVGLAVTTNLSINFLRKAPSGHDVIGEARLLKLGKRLAVGEVNLMSAADPGLVAHVTATYSIPPSAHSHR